MKRLCMQSTVGSQLLERGYCLSVIILRSCHIVTPLYYLAETTNIACGFETAAADAHSLTKILLGFGEITTTQQYRAQTPQSCRYGLRRLLPLNIQSFAVVLFCFVQITLHVGYDGEVAEAPCHTETPGFEL